MKRLFLVLTAMFQILSAQNFTDGFNFYIPTYDSTTQQLLPSFPINPISNDDFISISSDGHFLRNGRRINFWCNNITDSQVFPQKNYAGLIVGHIRKMGYNLMRFHFIDRGWGDGAYIFTPAQSTRSLDPGNLDKLEYLINEFKKNGVYINMNLHVARPFNELDGVQDADSLVDYAKSVTLFDSHLIMLQKEYARQLLTHVNPYTGLALVNDPVMAMVEITNENWFLHHWQANALKPIYMGGKLTVRHNNMLQDLWNECLMERYGSNEALNLEWQTGSTTAEEQIQNGGFEDGIIDPFMFNAWDPNTSATGFIDNDAASGGNSYKISIGSSAANTWDIQLIQPNLTIQKDSTYIISFDAKSSLVQDGLFSLQTNQGDFYYHFGTNIPLTEQWKHFEWRFTGSKTSVNIVEIMFQFGHNTGDIWLDNISVNKAPIPGLKNGESLEQKNIKRMYRDEIHYYSSKRVRTLFEFFVDLQLDYYREMHSFLKNELGIKVPISGSNWLAGWADLMIQSEMDYIDYHAYWDHPDLSTGRFNNQSMVKNPTRSTITNIFAAKVVDGKPFTISEYNHCYPNLYQVEGPFFFAAYGAYHDADALMMFGYSEGTGLAEGWEPDRILSSFNFGRHNVMSSFMPTFGYAYRNGLISGANNQFNIQLSNEDVYDAFLNNDGFWMFTKDYPYQLALTKKMRVTEFSSSNNIDLSSFPTQTGSPYVTDTGELTWDENGLFKIETDKLVGFVGFLHEFVGSQIGNIKIVSADKFAGVSLLSLDGEKLSDSEKMLLTVGTRQLNTGTQWASDFKSLTNSGDAPTIIDPTKLTFELNLNAESLTVYRLNTVGNKTGHKTEYLPVSPNKFRITIDQKIEESLWFGLETIHSSNPPFVINSINNGDFSSGLNSWNTYTGQNANAIASVNAGVMQLNISDGGLNSWDVQLTQSGVKLEKGKTYLLRLDASAAASRSISIGLSEDGGNYTNYGSKNITLSSQMKTYDLVFTMQSATNANARLYIDMGGSNTNVQIDNVYLGEPIPSDTEDEDILPTEYRLDQNYPNPFNPSTKIRYSIKEVGQVKLTVYDILGREVETLVNGEMVVGNYEINFDASELTSGIYFYTLQTGSFMETRKMILLR